MSSSENGAAAGRKTVLVVDDSALMRALIMDIVQASAQFVVIGEATTGYQAIRMVHELEPDIVTLDLEMPDLHGLDALAYIMTEKPRPVIVVSGQLKTAADATGRAIDYGAFEFVMKPHGDEAREFDVLRRRLLAALEAAACAEIANMRAQRVLRARAQREHQGQRVLDDFGDAVVGNIRDDNPALGSPLDVDVVEANPRAGDDSAPRSRVDDLGRYLGPAGEDGVDIGRQSRESFLVLRRGNNELTVDLVEYRLLEVESGPGDVGVKGAEAGHRSST